MTLIAVLAAQSVFADAATTEAHAASRLLDGTFACSVPGPRTGGYPDPIPRGGPRYLRVTISSEVRAAWRMSPAYIGMGSVFIGQGFGGIVKIGNERVLSTGSVSVDRKMCRPITDTRIPLSRRGTAFTARSTDYSGVECRVPARIVLRVRASLRQPASLIVRGGDYVLTSTNRKLVSAEVAVRTFPALKPIAYAHIARDGTAALYTSSSCS